MASVTPKARSINICQSVDITLTAGNIVTPSGDRK
jgi:hypothetical protein